MWLAINNPGCPGAVLGRTGTDIKQTLLPEFWAQGERFREATGVNLVVHYSRGDHCAHLVNGARIYFRPYDLVDKLRGANWAWAVVDEIERAVVDPKYAFRVIQQRVRHPKAKMLQLALGTTPNGMGGAVGQFFEMQRQGSKDYYVVRATTYDGVLKPEVIEAMKAGCSRRLWEQEGLGKILTPSDVYFSELDDGRHLVDWTWDDGLDWILAIDWGTSHAYFCAIQVEKDGRWVVAYEEKHENVGREKFRGAIRAFIASRRKPPVMIAADRAVKRENNWLRGEFGHLLMHDVKTCDSTEEQDVIHGLEMVRSMLDPAAPAANDDGQQRPRLVFSRRLNLDITNEVGRGIIGSLRNYKYRKNADGTMTNKPLKDDLNDHPIDALRYAVVKSAGIVELHGGDVLPYLQAHPHVFREAA